MLQSLTLGDVARENRRRFPDRLATVCGHTRLTFTELDARVSRLSNSLLRQGLSAGDRVLWLGQTCHRVVELALACSKIGAVLCPANWRQSPDELAFVITDCAPRVIVAQEAEVGPSVAAARAAVGDTCRWIYHDDPGPDGYEAFLASGADGDSESEVSDGASLLMIYTAAFEGRPNGALLSSRALIGEALLTAHTERLSHDDVFLVSGPLFHIGCWRYVLSTMMLGGANVFVRRVEAEKLCQLVHDERCTHAYLFAATQAQMAEVNRDSRYSLRSLRCVPGDAVWTAMVGLETNPWLARPQRYGQTEAGGIVARGAYGPPPIGRHGWTGPLAQLRILRDDGTEVDVGEAGEIVVRGPLNMNGYHNRPVLNAQKFRNGWLHTADLGKREADGSITFVGPKRRMLKSGMENIYPAEVEHVVKAHPDVADCAVIGIPDEKFIQAVKAVVVLKDHRSAGADDIIAFARAHLAHYKAPRSIVFTDKLPRSGDTVDYATLDRLYGGGGYPGGDTRTNMN